MQYARLVATLQQHQESPPDPSSSASPSRIPTRKFSSAESPEQRSSSESSPEKSRRNGMPGAPATASSSGEESPARSKIPTLRGPRSTSPPKKQPVFGWSLPTEKQLSPGQDTSSNSSRKSSDNSVKECSSSNGQQSNSSKKKQFEAFVMTGDRMICLAKTPANSEFVAKTVNLRQSGGLQQVPFEDLSNSVPCSPAKHDEAEEVILREPTSEARPRHLRNSTSEDQLLYNVISPSSSDLDDPSGSVDTLLGSEAMAASSSSTGNKESLLNKNAHQRKASLRLQQQSSLESSPGSKRHAHSPDFSTSSLISSEHYNGESLLEHDNLSPQTSSSPDTPEWSLMDSFHKRSTNVDSTKNNQTLLPIASVEDDEPESNSNVEELREDVTNTEAIKSQGNRVIITIGTNNANVDVSQLSEAYSSIDQPPPQSLNAADSSEESDLESLRSYHPPARPIDIPSAERLAKRLFYLEGFRRTDVSRHLGKNNEFSQVVAEEYLRFFDFGGGIVLDEALRRFLQHFCLTGETQERERVLLHFSRRYLECNPEFVETSSAKQLFRSLDAVHTLTCAIMLLNTDLHGDSVGLQRKMTCNEFIENLRELNDGQDFPRDLLRSIYYSIKKTPIPWAATLEELALPASEEKENGGSSDPVKQVISVFSDAGLPLEESKPVQDSHSETAKLAVGKTGGGINPFIGLPDASDAVDFKKGYVMRKCCVDPNGKKTKLGKRSWRMFFVNLRDMVLYCFKDEKSVRQAGAFEDFSAAIRIHHGLAVRASDYTKKQFVFRLHTADRAEYLFQTSDEKELLTWIDAINYVVASFSAPPLPAACSSAGRFQRPLMPSSKSSLSMAEQLSSHESQLGQLRGEFEELQRSAPPKSQSRSTTSWQNHREREEFLQFEIMRYETYILTLRTKNAHDS